MVYPVKTIERREPWKKLGDTHPVQPEHPSVLKNEKVIGLISKQVVEKAEYHGLKKFFGEGNMTTEFSVASPDTPFSRVQALIIGKTRASSPSLRRINWWDPFRWGMSCESPGGD